MANDLSRPHRIWRPQHLSTLELERFKKILGTTKYSTFRRLNSFFDRRISSWIPLQNLQSLKIKRGHLTRLWQRNLQATFDLKNLLLASMREFTKSLEMLPHLEHLVLEGVAANRMENSERERRMISSLKHLVLRGRQVIQAEILSKSLRKLSKLRVLVLRDCILSGKLDLNSSGSESTDIVSSQNSCTSSLEIIKMYNVKQTSKVSISGKHCPRFESLHIVSMKSLIELNITGVTTPHFLALEDCKRLERVSGNFYLAKLVILDCPKLQELPSLANSRFLESISVARCQRLHRIERLPTTSKYQHYHADFNIKSFLPKEVYESYFLALFVYNC
ncbi:hypothetical protein SUGI_1024690 [Cryptomeria japonica]|nr:hypothetical protein SUGI_1024690 [Cryptomeria japonica]